ncbi:protein PLANT CADMIUM RESISTANCE 6-like [Impatiens glandulifera]|uniref:protein PLANT CADMIUM RESISTANCE 6-like n=1 Tax=Impatiens glandulifera TaxID=253017 RepID=UPI001FB065EC|nr:protein PLANT CADMIUM RESISTANCE 6-like [Impatiens glandulifera]
MGRIESAAPPSPYNNDQQNNAPPLVNQPAAPAYPSLPVGQPEAYPSPPVNQPAAYPPPPVNQPETYPPPQVNQPEAYPPVNKPEAYPPVNKPEAYPPQGNYYPQTPPPAYPSPSPPPVQFPPTPTKGQFEANDPPPVQYPLPEENTQQQYNQYQQQQQQPQMNTNFAQFNQQIPVASGIPINVPASYNEEWTSGLFDCMNDPMNAVVTLCFPCLTFGQIAEIIDNGQTSCATSGLIYGLVGAFIGIPCIMSCSYRTKLRNKYGLIESPAPDWITHFLCEPCALCQAYRELEQRGLDPSIGWIGNVARQQQQAVMMVPATQNMNGY